MGEACQVNNEKKEGILKAVEKVAHKAVDAAKDARDFVAEQATSVREIAKDAADKFQEERNRRLIEKYKPIFYEDIADTEIEYPKIINIVDYDKRMEIDVCKNAIGYNENAGDMDIMGIYQKDVNKFPNIRFLPEKNPTSSIYYVHPLYKDIYIEIGDYFNYLSEQRVAELEYIAQELGAKHFRVQILEETLAQTITDKKAKAQGKSKDISVKAEAEKEEQSKQYAKLGVLSENFYPGSEPNEPILRMWESNDSIKSLIRQRLSKNPLQSKTFILNYNASSGIKSKEAAKIDIALKAIKADAAGTIKFEAKKESRRRLEYTIEF